MEKLYKIKEALMRKLDESNTARSGELDGGELNALHQITDTIKNIDKICALEDDGGYSSDMDGDYGRGSSYANRGQHYVRGHYSRDGGRDGYSTRRDSRGRYSRADGREEMIEHVRMAIDTAPDEYKEDIKRFLREIEG